MTERSAQVSADEQSRLEESATKPIHIVEYIQPHGALIAVDATSLEIQQVSANSAEVLGVAPSLLLGRSVQVLVSVEWLRGVLGSEDDHVENPFSVEIGGNNFDAIVHRSGSLITVEFEAASATDERLLPALNAAIRRISATRTIDALRQSVAREVRAFVKFDRAVIYHFHPDGHGEIVAEDRAPELDPYLNHHFPASDIPEQARMLLLRVVSQYTASSDYEPVPLIPGLGMTTSEPLDLSRAELRSVSPHHLQYLRNIGTATIVNLPLVLDGELMGMITCSAQTMRAVSYNRRRALALLAQQMTLQLGALGQRHHLEQQLEHQVVRSELIHQISVTGDISVGLCTGDVTLVDLIPADGAIARVGGSMMSVGVTPSPSDVLALARWVEGVSEPVRIRSDALKIERPDLAELVPSFAGIALWQCGSRGDFIAWLRREVPQETSWLGEQTPQDWDTPLSPSNSFAMWRQSATGRSQPWLADELAQIGELIRDIDGVRAQQAAASDLKRAAEVQRALQPKDSAPSPGFDVAGACMPTGVVGGDFYDWYSTEGGLAVTLGDVMGKGVGAGMIAAAVRTSLRADRNSRDSSAAVAHASAMLNADLAEASSFVTLFHARLNSATGEISYTDAGHGLSMILRRDGSAVPLRSFDYPIGLALGSSFTERSEMLYPGDMLISFSDGVLDMYDGTLDAIEVIADLARLDPSPQSLVESLVEQAGAVTSPDDVTVVAVRRKDDR